MAKAARFFKYDAFLSHNLRDGSSAVAAALSRAGVRPWHDGDADMSDRHVQEVVRQALGESRFICVCVGHEFRDSRWVQAEYNAGLELEKRFGVGRVVVVELAPNPPIPAALIDKPRFSRSRDLDFLSTFLLHANSRGNGNCPDPHLSADIIEQLRKDARRLKSLGDRHTAVHIYPDEQFKLAHERFVRAVEDQPHDRELIAGLWRGLTGNRGAMGSWTVRDWVGKLQYRDSEFWASLYAEAVTGLDRSLAVYEFLTSRPDICRLVALELTPVPLDLSRELYEPLAELLLSDRHRESAAKSYARLCSATASLLDDDFDAIHRSYAYDMIACVTNLEARERFDTRRKQWLEKRRKTDAAGREDRRSWWRRLRR